MHRRLSPASPAELALAGAIGARLEDWFGHHGRAFAWRDWRDEYRVLVTEILLQRTRAEVVASFVPRFLDRFPNWESLANAEPAELESVLAPLGLHRRRAASLRKLSSIPASARRTEAAPGVGQYIGRAARVSIDGTAEAMVDSNFVRILRRVFPGQWRADYRYDGRLQGLARAMVEGATDVRAVNWAILDLGALTCLPRTPRCDVCPISDMCSTARIARAPPDRMGSRR